MSNPTFIAREFPNNIEKKIEKLEEVQQLYLIDIPENQPKNSNPSFECIFGLNPCIKNIVLRDDNIVITIDFTAKTQILKTKYTEITKKGLVKQEDRQKDFISGAISFKKNEEFIAGYVTITYSVNES